ncbi:hypothetical protein PA598K_02758 [Paenibacillus sp. 598K]|nr:hypothetical protein PA598K_02758 [Paenibacillus sp. 598K]
MAANLIPEEVNSNDYKIVQVDAAGTANETTIIEVQVPGLGTYIFTVKYAKDSPITFISKIELQPN